MWLKLKSLGVILSREETFNIYYCSLISADYSYPRKHGSHEDNSYSNENYTSSESEKFQENRDRKQTSCG